MTLRLTYISTLVVCALLGSCNTTQNNDDTVEDALDCLIEDTETEEVRAEVEAQRKMQAILDKQRADKAEREFKLSNVEATTDTIKIRGLHIIVDKIEKKAHKSTVSLNLHVRIINTSSQPQPVPFVEIGRPKLERSMHNIGLVEAPNLASRLFNLNGKPQSEMVVPAKKTVKGYYYLMSETKSPLHLYFFDEQVVAEDDPSQMILKMLKSKGNFMTLAPDEESRKIKVYIETMLAAQEKQD